VPSGRGEARGGRYGKNTCLESTPRPNPNAESADPPTGSARNVTAAELAQLSPHPHTALCASVATMGRPAPEPVVLRGHGADVQSVTFAVLNGVHCVLSGCVAALPLPPPTLFIQTRALSSRHLR